MDIYKASSIRDLLSKENLEKEIDNLTNIDIYPINTSGLSGSKMYKIELYSNKNKKYLYLKVNNLQEDWLAKASNDKGPLRKVDTHITGFTQVKSQTNW